MALLKKVGTRPQSLQGFSGVLFAKVWNTCFRAQHTAQSSLSLTLTINTTTILIVGIRTSINLFL